MSHVISTQYLLGVICVMDMPELHFPMHKFMDVPEVMELGPSIHSGEATFAALKNAVESLKSAAPETCDVFIRAYDLTAWEIRFIEPHAFIFSGITDEGHDAREVIHFSQLRARVVYRPKDGKIRRLIGFCRNDNDA